MTQGNLVGGTDQTVIATIVQLDPIHIYWSPSEKERLDVLRLRKEGRYVQRDEIEVHAVLADGSEYPHLGKLDFVDNTVDPNVGTVRVRAVFPNPDKALLPGEYAKLRILVGRDVPVLLVPAQAIVEEQGGSTVFVVGADGTIESRSVTVGAASGTSRVIESGLQAGEQVAIDNLGKLRPGATVSIRATSPRLAARLGPRPREALAQALHHHEEDGHHGEREERREQHAAEDGGAEGVAARGAGARREHERQHAEDERERRHQDGAEADARGMDRGVLDRLALLAQGLRELDHENRVLAREADEHHQADLAEHVVLRGRAAIARAARRTPRAAPRA